MYRNLAAFDLVITPNGYFGLVTEFQSKGIVEVFQGNGLRVYHEVELLVRLPFQSNSDCPANFAELFRASQTPH